MANKRRSAAPGPQLAYVLHQHDWSETSLVVELFTRELGRVVTVAKGAKRPTSNFRAVLLHFQRLQVQLGAPAGDEAGEVHGLRSAEWAGGVPTSGGGALLSAFYLNELLLKFLPRQDPHPALFDAYATTLSALRADDEPANQAALRAFELGLLRTLGWLPDLACVTATQQPLQPGAQYVLHSEAGLVAAAGGLAAEAWQAIDAALAAPHASALLEAVRPWRTALRMQLRELLHYHLGTSTLRTRQLREGLQRLQPLRGA